MPVSSLSLKPRAFVAALIAYGSLYPFDYHPPESLSGALNEFFLTWTLWTSRGDVLGNVGLFAVYGVAGLAFAESPDVRRRAVRTTLLSGLVLAFLLQVAQIWIQSRSAILADVLWNALGLGLGVLAGAMLAASAPARVLRFEPARMVALSLVALWLLAELAPLVPSIDLEGFRSSLRPLRQPPTIDVASALYHGAQLLLLIQLIAVLAGSRHVMLGAAAAVGLVLGGKLVIVEQSLDWTVVASLAGGCLAWFLLASGRRTVAPQALLAILLGAYSLAALEPFERGGPYDFSWIPFATSLDGTMLTNVRALASAAFTLGGCVWLMRDLGWPVFRSSVGLAFWVLALEVSQIWIVGRTPGSTEPILALFAGWALTRVAGPRSSQASD